MGNKVRYKALIVFRNWWGGSVSKGTNHQGWQPEFYPRVHMMKERISFSKLSTEIHSCIVTHTLKKASGILIWVFCLPEPDIYIPYTTYNESSLSGAYFVHVANTSPELLQLWTWCLLNCFHCFQLCCLVFKWLLSNCQKDLHFVLLTSEPS